MPAPLLSWAPVFQDLVRRHRRNQTAGETAPPAVIHAAPAGADRIITFDPPGAIGLPPDGAVVLLRFDEQEDAQHPMDAAGNLIDLAPVGALTVPPVVGGVLGRARSFSATSGFAAQDLAAGSTLLTRDLSIQVVLSLDTAGQSATGQPGTVIARGTGATSSEYTAFALELIAVAPAAGTWVIRFRWQDVAGATHTTAGILFVAPAGFTMLTATRRWISPTAVLCRYYIGDILLGEETDGNGGIGGGTTGTMQIGGRIVTFAQATSLLSVAVTTSTGGWTATLLASSGTTVAISFVNSSGAGAGTVELRDNQAWVSGTWTRSRGVVGVLVIGDIGDPVTVTALEAALGTSALVSVSAHDPHPTATIGMAVMDDKTATMTWTMAGALVAKIDELLVLDHEITREEIEATWLRITRYQPYGVQLFTELHDPGFPLPNDPTLDVQLETRMIGNAIGYAAAQAENLRANMLPQRAYGSVLDDWEAVVQPSKEPLHDVDTRRARVLAKLQQRNGSSPAGLENALEHIIGGAPHADLQFLAYSNTIVEPFATIDPLRWDVTPAASWIAAGGGARSSLAAGDYQFTTALQHWNYMQMPVGGDGKQAHLISKVVMTTATDKLEAGLFFGQRASGDFLLLGLRDTAGAFTIVTESFQGFVSQGVEVQDALLGNPASLWLWLSQTTTNGMWQAQWSTSITPTGFVSSDPIAHPTVAQWGGLYVRSIGGATVASGQIDADDLTLRAPFGHRPFNAYVLLDAALGFTPDVDGAHDIIQAIKHAFVNGTFITNKNLLCGAPFGCGRGPMGGGL